MNPENGEGVAKKYADINRRGRKALAEGAVTEHAGWPEHLRNRFNASVIFDETSRIEIKKRILDRIEEIEKKLGISIYLAGRDFPIHSTLQEAKIKEAGTEPNVLFAKMAEDETEKEVEQTLTSKEVKYKYILIDKGNILLTAIEIPQEILDARNELIASYEREKLEPLPMKDILHITLGRISKLPSDENERRVTLAQYEKELVVLRHEISKAPLQLKIAKLNYGSAYDLLNGKI